MTKKAILCVFLTLVTILLYAQFPKKITINSKDSVSGYYLAVEPVDSIPVTSVLVLLAGFSQHAEDIFPETRLAQYAYSNNILTIGFAAGYKLYADSTVQANLSAVLQDVKSRYKIGDGQFVLGGYSAGGIIVLRYAELCYQFPQRFPIHPKGVFTIDSPIDLFTLWNFMEETVKTNFSRAAVDEANEGLYRMKKELGIPSENVEKYNAVSPFSMDSSYGDNEKYLQHIPVRTYHDVDIVWRLKNRMQTVHNSNYEVCAEFIYRLMLLGNTKAEFIQSNKKGYRSNGMRHPHSWSIVDEPECIDWIKSCFDR